MKKIVCIVSIVLIAVFLLSADENIQKKLSLEDAIFYALKNNLALQVEMTNTEYYWNALKVNKAIFVPTLQVNANSSESNTPSTSAFAGADITTNTNSSLDFIINQNLAFGGNIKFSLENSRFETNSIYSTINPSLSTIMTFSLSQPLLKNFGMLSTKKDIYIATNDYKKFKHQLRQTIIDLVYNVEEAYWNLVYAYQNLEATRMSLQRSKDLLRQNEIKVKVGTAAKIDILEAQAEVASYESQMIQAEQSIQTAEDNLKEILNMSQSKETFFPADTPQVMKINTDFDDFLLEALNHRPDIEKSRLELKNYNIYVKYFRNQLLPDLRLTASYYTTGQGGDQLIFDVNPFYGGHVIGVVSKDFWKTLQDNVANLYHNYSVGLSLSIPLNLSKERAQLAQARINLKKAFLGLKNIENTIYSEVKAVIKELQTNLKLVEANKIALELEEQKLKAEQKKLSVGLSTNFQVLNFQRDYANAQANALRSLINYNLTIAKLNKILVRTFKVYHIKFDDFLKN
jgi:outer membrane protein TolC